MSVHSVALPRHDNVIVLKKHAYQGGEFRRHDDVAGACERCPKALFARLCR